nr:integrase, catalytic region, zinc finger, CCHC-type, peptidase aspartic, catalytic [Tanacetum cinerariifolium]
MIMPSKDNLYNGRKDFEKIDSPFQQTSSLKPYVPNVILEKIIIDLEDEVVNLLEKEKVNLETIESLISKSFESSEKVCSELKNQSENDCLVIEKECDKEENPKQTSSLKPYVLNVILEKIIIDLEDEVVSLLEKEKKNLETIESLKSKGFESWENVSSKSKNQSENDCLVVEEECHKEENPKVIALGMFKLNVSECVSPISMSKSSCDSKNVEIKLKRKRLKRKSSKQNVKHVDNDVLRANSDFVYFLDLDTFSSVRRPKNSDVIWKKKGRLQIAGYGDVVIGSMIIKKVYYVEGLGHNLFSVGQFCDKGLEVAFQKSTSLFETKMV